MAPTDLPPDLPAPDLRSATGQLPSWADVCRMLDDPDQLDRLRRTHLGLLRALGIVDVAPNGEPYLLPLLLDGAILRHRLSAAEVAGDHLELDPDLGVYGVPAERGILATTGEVLRLGTSAHLTPPTARRVTRSGRRLLHGPPGWLRQFRAGDLIAVQLLDATLLVRGCRTEGGTTDVAARLSATAATAIERVADRGGPAVLPLEALVLGEMAADPTLFHETAVAPLAEVLEAASLPHDLGYVGRPGPTSLALPPHARGNTANELLPSELPDEQLTELLELGRLIGRFGLGVDDPLEGRTGERVLAPLRDWRTVDHLAVTAGAEVGTRALVDTLLPGAPRALRAPLHHLRAAHHLRTGSLAHALSDIDAALRTAPDVPEVVAVAAQVHTIVGDRSRTAALLGHLPDSHPLHRICDALLAPAGATALDRARCLHARANAYLVMAGCGDLDAHQRHDVERRGLQLGHLPEEMLVDDLLHHRAGLARVIREVGPLLADDELALLRRWAATRRRWWWRLDADTDGACLRALDDGTEVRASWPWPGPGAEGGFDPTGALVLARVLPTGSGWWMAPGALTVEEDVAVDALPDPSDIIGVRLWCARPDRTDPRSRAA